MVSGFWTGISQSQVRTSESLRSAGMVIVGEADGTGSAVELLERVFTASAADRNTTPAVSMYLALIIYPY
jgi:hypothetical protein